MVLAALAIVAGACAGGSGSAGLSPDTALKVNDWNLSRATFLDELQQVASNQRYLQARTATNGGAPYQVFQPGTTEPVPAAATELLNERVSFRLAEEELQRRNVAVTDADRQQAIGLVGASLQRAQNAASPPAASPDTSTTSTTIAITDETRQLGQAVLDGFPGSYRQVLLDGLSSLVALQRSLSGGGDNETQIRDLYEKTKEETCVSQILVKPNPQAGQADPQTGKPIIGTDVEYQQALIKATELRLKLIGGADFAATAKESSDDTTTKDRGGDLGCRPRLSYVQAFDDAVWQLEPNTLSEPVKTDFGYHLVLVREKRVVPFEEARPALEQAVVQDQGNKLQAWLTEATKTARVDVNAAYGTWDPFNGTVVPPGGQSTNLTLAPLESTGSTR